MTLKDLQSDVYALGYERPLEDSELFMSALNQAMRMIYAEQKYKKSSKIRVRRAEEASHSKGFKYTGEPLTLPLVGRAYSIRLCGRGSLSFDNGECIREEEFDGDDVLLRGFIKGRGSVTFLGDYSYDILSLVTYSDIFSNDICDIPDGSGSFSFDFSKNGDFLEFCDVARDALGREIPDVLLEGSRLTAKCKSSRDIYIRYILSPKRITADDPYLEIDISRADESALTFLCASLLWRDDEPELADHYYSLYREMQLASQKPHGSRSAKYELCDGWA